MGIEEIKDIMLEIAEIIKKYPEQLQERAFDIMTDNIFDMSKNRKMIPEVIESTDENSPGTPVNKVENEDTIGDKKSKRRNCTKETYQISKDLNLSPKDVVSLKAFVEEKQPKSNIEFNTVVIYYLEKILKKEKINVDDVYSCYKNVNRKVPTALKQSLGDTSSSKYGYISTANNCFSIPITGENFVEHELPKNKGVK